MLSTTAATIALLVIAAYYFGTRKARSVAVEGGSEASLHSRPSYHGLYSGLWTAFVGFSVFLGTLIASDYAVDYQMRAALPEDVQQLREIKKELIIRNAVAQAEGRIVAKAADENEAQLRTKLANHYTSLNSIRMWGIVLSALISAVLAFLLTYSQVSQVLRARNRSEYFITTILFVCAGIAILTTLGIVLSLIGETLKFFSHVPVWNFLFGTHWSPLSGVFEGTVDPMSVGAVPLFAGTFMITIIAMLVAVPIGLLAAIYLSDYAGPTIRAWAKPLLEILAGIPTVVYGFFAAITVAPFIRGSGEAIGLSVASESALAAGLVMGIMIIPFISSLSDDVINAVPQSLRDGSYGLGATKAETITKVVLPAALPGIVSAVLLGVSRAVGETMIVVMAAGQGANLTWNPLEAVTTVTVQIVALITGDTEADTAAGPAFALGFTLFCVTLILNYIALRVVQKYRQKYD